MEVGHVFMGGGMSNQMLYIHIIELYPTLETKNINYSVDKPWPTIIIIMGMMLIQTASDRNTNSVWWHSCELPRIVKHLKTKSE